MYADRSRILGVAIAAGIASGVFLALLALQLGVQVAYATNQIAPNVILSLTVPAGCEISLNTQSISFGTITASQNSLTTSQNVLDTNGGNGGAVIAVSGSNWVSGGNNFGVSNTVYSSSSSTSYASGTALTLIPANTAIVVGSSSSTNVWFGLGIPAGQVASTYSQNIIITNVC